MEGVHILKSDARLALAKMNRKKKRTAGPEMLTVVDDLEIDKVIKINEICYIFHLF